MNINSDLSLLDIMAVIWINRKKIIYITLAFIAFGIIYVMVTPNWYQSNVKIMPTGAQSNTLLRQYSNLASMAGINFTNDTGDKFALYPEIIQSNFILDRVLNHKFKNSNKNKNITLFEFWGEDIDSTDISDLHKKTENAKRELKSDYISASIDKKTNLLTLTVLVPRDPLLSAELANYIVELLNIYNIHYRHYKAKDQRIFIEESVNENKDNLKKAETALRLFQEENKDISSPDKKLEYERLFTELQVQRNIYIELRKQLEISKIEEIKETETIDILETATVPVQKFKPKRVINLISFTLVGIAFAVSSILIINLWNKIYPSLKRKLN